MRFMSFLSDDQFQYEESGLPVAHSAIEETFAPSRPAFMTAWILEQTTGAETAWRIRKWVGGRPESKFPLALRRAALEAQGASQVSSTCPVPSTEDRALRRSACQLEDR
jgi:hypothetical protein